jgi:FkbH-like protein
MYESEANYGSSHKQQELPAEIVAQFAESRQSVTMRSVIPWGEHCSECVWPTCYSTCDLYSPRVDGRCRRFVNGTVRLDCPGSLNHYLLEISFKRWAKLWSEANMRLYTVAEADRLERDDLRVAKAVQLVRIPGLPGVLAKARYLHKRRQVRRAAVGGKLPDCLLVECYNPNRDAIAMTLTIRCKGAGIPFQASLPMQPGFNRHRVAVSEIVRSLNPAAGFEIELTPNEVRDGCTLLFGALDFVIDTAYRAIGETGPSHSGVSSAGRHLCKCVVWDLDNTLWDGTLMEDGAEKLRLKPGVAEILKGLDARGILISAVSKNNHEDAMSILKGFGIDEYFLFPQISWSPKSEGVQRIAQALNIGTDSLLFLDDSAFEREQVLAMCEGVVVLDAAEYRTLLERHDCQTPVTEESKKRRWFYREEESRGSAQAEFKGDYFTFLRNCHLRLTIHALGEQNMERTHELAQRTNQMNFSGNRYTREKLRELLNREEVDTYVLDCEDRFGAYGTIGFCSVDRREPRMIDLMFSCRIQSKRVEHAFLSYLLGHYRELGKGDFFANYRRTSRNSGPGKVFDDFGFETAGEISGVAQLVFRYGRTIPDDGLVAVLSAEKR